MIWPHVDQVILGKSKYTIYKIWNKSIHLLTDVARVVVYPWPGVVMAKMIVPMAKMNHTPVTRPRRNVIPPISSAIIPNVYPADGAVIMKTTVVMAVMS